jgi:hypothetical protein
MCKRAFKSFLVFKHDFLLSRTINIKPGRTGLPGKLFKGLLRNNKNKTFYMWKKNLGRRSSSINLRLFFAPYTTLLDILDVCFTITSNYSEPGKRNYAVTPYWTTKFMFRHTIVCRRHEQMILGDDENPSLAKLRK